MGVMHLDAGVVIGLLDADDAHHHGARERLASAVEDHDQLAIAASALAECLVAPARHGEAAVGVALDLIGRLPISVVALDAPMAAEAARLRARHRPLRLPDALVIATASIANADKLVTTDRRWPSAPDMRLRFQIELV